jgi:quercetin dioxygenase-like cupin family protein
MADEPAFDLSRFPVHLGLGASVVPQEEFTGSPDWYERYGERNAGDGTEGRLVSMHTFDRSWDSWEMHPKGDELVVCTAGSITLHQEIDGATTTVTLGVGDAVINPPGAWHTADVDGTATALFVTAGEGTQVRPR